MSAEAAEALASAVAAVKLDLAWIYTTWSLQGPSLEACTALTAMAQEEAGHARALLGVAGVERRDHGIPSLQTMPETWPDLVGTAGTAELAVVGVVRALSAGANEALAARTAKMVVEESFHENLFRGWFPLLAADAPGVADRLAAAVRRTTPEVEKWLSGLDMLAVEAGVAGPEQPTRCPWCHGPDTELVSAYGPSLMSSLYRCRTCKGDFEAVRWRAEHRQA